ncbi:MAG: glycosyltransferase [Candidatus Pacearchaeota archaeon]
MGFRFLSYYGMLALTHLFIQISLGHREYLNQLNEKEDKQYYPKIAIIIPSYNEEPNNVLKCVKSCLNQKYKGDFKVYFIDDGSKDKRAVEVLKTIKDKRLIIIDNKENRGKREAQKCAFDIIPEDIDIFITVDSDASLDKMAVYYIVQPFKDEKIGGVTANVRGKSINILSHLIDLRYFVAFNQERASQSLFGTVFCMCGVLSAYRAKIIRKVKEEYVNQYFLGQKCSYGDDRYLTNLVLREGYKTKYQPKSKVITSVPLTLKSWLSQQRRWAKSYLRELIITFKMLWNEPKKLHPYAWYDMIIQFILPIMLTISLILMIFNTIFSGIIFLFGYLAVLIGVALIRGVYSFIRTKDLRFFIFPIYAFLHVFLLIPNKYYAWFTLYKNSWGTRELNNGQREYSKI